MLGLCRVYSKGTELCLHPSCNPCVEEIRKRCSLNLKFLGLLPFPPAVFILLRARLDSLGRNWATDKAQWKTWGSIFRENNNSNNKNKNILWLYAFKTGPKSSPRDPFLRNVCEESVFQIYFWLCFFCTSPCSLRLWLVTSSPLDNPLQTLGTLSPVLNASGGIKGGINTVFGKCKPSFRQILKCQFLEKDRKW